MQYTSNYGLKKPDGTDTVDIQNLNDNAQVLDEALTPTVDAAKIPVSNGPFKLADWVSYLTNRIKAITGKVNWYDTPSRTLEDVNTHISDTMGAHGATAAATANKIILRDTAGRAKVAAPGAGDDIARKDTVDAVQGNLNAHLADNTAHGLGNGIQQNYTLTWGMNHIQHTGDIPISPRITAAGLAYTNLVGKDGNCEDLSKWTYGSLTISLDATNKVFGDSSVKGVLTSTYGYTSVSNNYRPALVQKITGKYLLVSVYLKNGNASMVQCTFNTNETGQTNLASIAVTDTTKFVRVGIKVPAATISTDLYSLGMIINGSSGQYAYMDGVMVNEITASEYSGMTVDQLLAKYPYADSDTWTKNLYMENRRYNLVDNGNTEKGVAGWTIFNGTGTFTIVNNVFSLYSSANDLWIGQDILVKPNTNYYISGNMTGVGRLIEITGRQYGTNIVLLDIYSDTGATFNTGVHTKIRLLIRTTTGNTSTYGNIMLIEGTTAPSTYKSCDLQKYVIEMANPFTQDDSLTIDAGQITAKYWWKQKTLYGKDYSWEFFDDAVTHKRITLYHSDFSRFQDGINNYICSKYDGKTLFGGLDVWQAADRMAMYQLNQSFTISVADTDSGWAETINPKDNEVKAFMNGWRAVAYGTRYVGWASVVDGSVPAGSVNTVVASNSSSTTLNVTAGIGTNFRVGASLTIWRNNFTTWVGSTGVVSTAANAITINSAVTVQAGDVVLQCDDGSTHTELLNWCMNNVAPGYEGYRIRYKLQNPEYRTDLNTCIIGNLWDIVPGDNYITVDAGVVLGELANPVLYSGGYYINDNVIAGGLNASILRNRTEIIQSIYKNKIQDKWGIYNNVNSYGNQMADILQANFDPNATYTVDYKIIAPEAPQAISSLAMSHMQDVFSSIKGLSQGLEQKQQKDVVLDRLIDLSMYESASVSSGLPYQRAIITAANGAYCAYVYDIQFGAVKKSIPIISINNVIVTVKDNSGANITNPISDILAITVSPVTTKYFRIGVFLKAGTNATYAVNNGITVTLNWTADCRGRI